METFHVHTHTHTSTDSQRSALQMDGRFDNGRNEEVDSLSLSSSSTVMTQNSSEKGIILNSGDELSTWDKRKVAHGGPRTPQ